jgi:hypothetical protein
MKRVFFESKESVGHIDVPDDAIITTNEDDEEMEDQTMYPAGLKMEGDDGNEEREVLGDDDNNDPLDRENGMYPDHVKE